MIDYGADIPHEIVCLPDTMYVEDMEYGERKKGGLFYTQEKMDMYGEFVRPRWSRVLFKADNIKDIEAGDWIAICHGHWSTSMNVIINGKPKKVWYISPKSYREGLIAVSKTMPEELKGYGIGEKDA
jgi:hypothetical protein